MKFYKPCIYLIAATLSQYGFAKTEYQAYRLGNYNKAFQTLHEQASQEPVADYYLGRLYLYGYGQLKNKALALRYFKQSASKGYLPAQLLLARYHLQVSNNPETAFKWFKKAADQGDMTATMYVAGAYLFGYGTKKNAGLARRYYIDAAKDGNAIAQYTLAEYFLDSRYASNRKLGLIWLKKSATEGNNPRAQARLGELYLHGKHVKTDLSTAREWFEKAQAQNFVPAMTAMGDLAMKQENSNLALDWYLKAAEKNNVQAQLKLAQMYLNEKNSFHSKEKGFMWTLKAAQSGAVDAQKQLAELYEKGIGTLANKHLSDEWLKKAEKNNSDEHEPSARQSLALWLSNDTRNTLTIPQYEAGGIFTAWNNPEALKNSIYNQSPQQEIISKEDLFKPQFILTQPNEVPISDFYDTLSSVDQSKQENQWTFPLYPLSKHLEAQLQANSNVLRHHEVSLPYADSYYLPEEPHTDILAHGSWNEEIEDNYNYLAIFSDLYSRAILGNSQAQFHVGQMFEYGLGVYKSEQQAITFYEKAAAQQNMAAQYSLALIYLKHEDDPDLYLRGFEWLNDAAFKGNRYAQYVMAHVLSKHPGSPGVIRTDDEQALSMLYLSAANGYGRAQYELAERLTHDKNSNLNVAIKNERRQLVRQLYEGAAEQGVTQALVPFAFFNAMDKNPKAQKEAFEIAKVQADAAKPGAALLLGTLYDRGIGVVADQQKAIFWYQQADDNAIRKFILGTYIYQGKNLYEDKEKGKQMLQQSASAGFSYAHLNLAVLAYQNDELFLGELVKAYRAGNSKAGILLADYTLAESNSLDNLEQAKAIYTKLAEKGDQQAQLKLAYMYDKGIGTVSDEKAAHHWYQASAEQDNAIAQYQLAQMYQLGYEGAPDYAKALSWYKKAAVKLPKAWVAIGFIEETVFDQYDKATKAYLKAALEDNTVGTYNLALMYEYGKGVPVDYDKARKFYTLAAKKGLAEAANQLAVLNFYGLGEERDPQKALALYKKAADKGESNALYQLGLLSETGVATRLDYQHAINYYKQAAEKGNEKAMIALARMYQYGLGVTKDRQEAMTIYQQLAKRNNAYAQYQLGSFYLEGVAGERMPDKGIKWLESARKNGSTAAQKRLQSLDAQSQDKVSYVEPVMMNQAPVINDQAADMVYLDALSEWNRGDEILSRMIFHRLINKFPDYIPAKRAYEQLNQSIKSRNYS